MGQRRGCMPRCQSRLGDAAVSDPESTESGSSPSGAIVRRLLWVAGMFALVVFGALGVVGGDGEKRSVERHDAERRVRRRVCLLMPLTPIPPVVGGAIVGVVPEQAHLACVTISCTGGFLARRMDGRQLRQLEGLEKHEGVDGVCCRPPMSLIRAFT